MLTDKIGLVSLSLLAIRALAAECDYEVKLNVAEYGEVWTVDRQAIEIDDASVEDIASNMDKWSEGKFRAEKKEDGRVKIFNTEPATSWEATEDTFDDMENLILVNTDPWSKEPGDKDPGDKDPGDGDKDPGDGDKDPGDGDKKSGQKEPGDKNLGSQSNDPKSHIPKHRGHPITGPKNTDATNPNEPKKSPKMFMA